MKRLLSMVAGLLVVMACDAPQEPRYASDAERIADIWYLEYTRSLLSGTISMPDSADTEHRIVFSKDGYLTWYDDLLWAFYRSQYSLGMMPTVFHSDSVPVVYLDTLLAFEYTFFGDDTLVLTDNDLGGYERSFTRR